MKTKLMKFLSVLFAASILFTSVPQNSFASNVSQEKSISVSTVLPIFLVLKAEAKKVADSLPNDLMEDDETVDLGKFKDKNGNTPKDKSSGEFKYGRWTITKDTAGHIGWNGNPKKWKLNKDGDRQASLDENGVVLGK